ncbi:MAG: HDOD domain-containing protein [Deltaproteobacteria bacterium]|nr:HDOD domain-containing protein [Deltaproteobacteria bacterium]MCB9785627.1 HDOD domain-containing protein [Deltaproteobacteria bacterium]
MDLAPGAAARDRLRRRIEARIDALPVLPATFTRLMALDPGAEDYHERLVAIVEESPTFAARVMSAANSAESAPRATIATVRAAVTRIGSLRTVELVAAHAVAMVFVPREPWEKAIWRHAVLTATAARMMAARARDRHLMPDEVYLAGLLHDIGRFIMLAEVPDLAQQLEEGRWASAQELAVAERGLTGTTHMELGAEALRRWRLPETLVLVARDHHDPEPAATSTRVGKLVALVRFADAAMRPASLPGSAGLAEADDHFIAQALVGKLPPFVFATEAELAQLVRLAAAEGEAVCGALGIGETLTALA